MVKRILNFLFAILFCACVAYTQWITQQSNFPVGVTPHTISAVSEEIAWASGMAFTGVAPNTSDWFCRTLDGGDHWITGRIPIPNDHLISSITAISANVAWVSVASDSLSSKVGVYKTMDGGETWTQQTNGLPNEAIFICFVYFFNENDGVVVYDREQNYCPIFTTGDGGSAWERVPNEKNIPMLYGESPNINMYSVAENIIYRGSMMSTVGRVFKSMDKGKSWSVSKCDFATSDYTLVWPGFKDAQNGMIVALAPAARGVGAAMTHDGATTWSRVTSPPVSAHFVASIPGTAAGYLAVGVNYWNPTLPIYPGSAFTLDNGATWTKIDDVPRGTPVFVSREVGWAADAFSTAIYKWFIDPKPFLGYNPKKTIEFSTTKTGGSSQPQTIFITNYGQEPLVISELITGLNVKITSSFSLPKSITCLETVQIPITFAPAVAGKVVDSVIVVSNAVNVPRLAIQCKGQGIAIAQAKAGVLYAVSANSLYTIDPASAKATLVGKTPFTSLNSIAVNPSTLELIASSAQSASTNINYIDATTAGGALMGVIAEGYLRAIAFKSDTLYGATPTGKLFCLDVAAASATLRGSSPETFYFSIAVHPVTGLIYASMQSFSGVIKDRIVTIDAANGDTTLIGATGDGLPTPSIAFSPSGTLYGLKGTGTTVNTLITIDPQTGAATLIGSTGISGLRAIAWAPSTTLVDEPAEPDKLPEGFALLQNYPNPFNSETIISFILPKAERVMVKIYDILGHEIELLTNSFLPAGRHKFVLNANALSSGVYLCRMTAGQFSATIKVTVIK